MKKYLNQVVSIAMLGVICFCQLAVAEVVKIESWDTKNGIPVYFVKREEIPMLDVAIIFEAGSRYDGSYPGLAQLTAGLMNQGAGDYSADDIADGFERVGSEFSGNIGRDTASFHVRMLTDEDAVNQSFHYLHTLLTKPTFPMHQLQRLRKQSLQSLKLREQSASTKAVDLFYQNLYPNGPYRYPVSGTKGGLEMIKREDIQRFFANNYHTGHAKIIMVGDIETFEAKGLANNLSKDIPFGVSKKAKMLPLPMPESKKIKEMFPGPQTAIVIGQLGIERDDPHYYALQVGNSVLGSMPFSSRLFSEVREKEGLTYHVSSGFSPMKEKGPFSIMLQTKNESAEKAIEVTQNIVEKFLTNGPSLEELALAKKNINGSFPLAFASNASILQQVAALAVYDLPLTYFDEYRDNIDNVTQLQVQQAFRRTLKPDQWLLIQVGNA